MAKILNVDFKIFIYEKVLVKSLVKKQKYLCDGRTSLIFEEELPTRSLCVK